MYKKRRQRGLREALARSEDAFDGLSGEAVVHEEDRMFKAQ